MALDSEIRHDPGHGSPVRLRLVLALGVLAGILGMWVGTGRNPQHAWSIFLANFLFWSGIGAAGPVFAAILDITHARWPGSLRRLALSFGAFLPVSVGLLLLFGLGLPWLYPWVEHPPAGRAVWFQPRFFVLRDCAALLIVTLAAFAFAGFGSRARPPGSRSGRAVFLLLVYPFAFSLVAVDLVMSLTPTWVSTLFPAYFFMGNIFAAVAALLPAGLVGHRVAVSDRQAHDLGKILLGFSMLWAYLFWSQYLVIWYGNIGEEIQFLLARSGPGWQVVSWTVLALCFAVPFVLLLSRAMKHPAPLRALSWIVLAGIWLERVLLVAPAVESEPVLAAADLPVTIGFAALFAHCRLEIGDRLWPPEEPGAV